MDKKIEKEVKKKIEAAERTAKKVRVNHNNQMKLAIDKAIADLEKSKVKKNEKKKLDKTVDSLKSFKETINDEDEPTTG